MTERQFVLPPITEIGHNGNFCGVLELVVHETGSSRRIYNKDGTLVAAEIVLGSEKGDSSD